MKTLLDTCTFLWLISDYKKLSSAALDAYKDPVNDIFLSVISAWEITLKHSLNQLELAEPPDKLIAQQRKKHDIQALPLHEEAVAQLPRLPTLHRDPFDRMLVCQAVAYGMAIITPDELVQQYPVRTIW